MNDKKNIKTDVSEYQLNEFHNLITMLFQCCQDRLQFQSKKFQLPDAELRCLMFFKDERYLTSKGISSRMNVTKSRVTKIISGLQKKDLIKKIIDPEDSRIHLISLTAPGKRKLKEIQDFQKELHKTVLTQINSEERKKMLTHLDLLKGCMEAGKEMMAEQVT